LSPVSREGFRRKLKKIKNKPGLDLEITNKISREVSRQMHGLYLQTAHNAEIEFEELAEDYFAVVSECAPDNNKCFLWRRDGRLVAFAQCLIKGDRFIDHYLGFDYALAYEYNFYYLRFKALLEWCIANKMAVYEIGQSSYEIKRRLGFDFSPLYVYARPCGRLNRPVFNFYHKFLASDRFDHIKKG